MRKVVITGIGAVNSLGNNANEYWDALIEGRGGIKRITRVPVDKHETKLAAEVNPSFEAEATKYWRRRQLSIATTSSRIALAAAGEAITDCGADFSKFDGSKGAAVYGVIDNCFEDDERKIYRHIALKTMSNEVPALVSIKCGFTGPVFSVSTACASSSYAITLGKQFIESGMCDMVYAGGNSITMAHIMLDGFNQILAMSVNEDPKKSARPFTKNRDGFIMGEGAGALILESEESAKKRNAKIYCELAGATMYGEAFDMTAPQTDGIGMAKCMEQALRNAGITPDDVDYINAHGTSTVLNDLYETRAIKKVFGQRAYDIPVSSIKAAIGHTMGGCGVLEAIACIKAIQTGIIPPTINYDEPDPELDLNYVPNKAIEHNVNIAISNSFGFGGHDATLVFRKYE